MPFAKKIGKQWKVLLVGGFNPFEKYWSKWKSSSNRDENEKYLKPSARLVFVRQKICMVASVLRGLTSSSMCQNFTTSQTAQFLAFQTLKLHLSMAADRSLTAVVQIMRSKCMSWSERRGRSHEQRGEAEVRYTSRSF